eukprot:CAMPEP_0206613006 /NCGR_PEP_ID=MMETSP0325_2-20121206/56385_1 /ASSEMBLY_ACC=CAM_ASM_000347 /TAXON_ID=2866 /ORGANISM="Crypthecodinium cohnii, Strain Seligo" /LENGTH=38 /DNA_ID= /DNA_START= /DNA_END= /DNA_ORIENTATION=
MPETTSSTKVIISCSWAANLPSALESSWRRTPIKERAI